jgi:WD40 repeat protein
MRFIRVFVSSPGDAESERKRVVRVMERLNAAFAGTAQFKPVLWEERFYSAHDSFQQQIERSTDCDIVVAILRGRLGTPLPPDFMARLPAEDRVPDVAAYQSGTAYEILSAIAARRRGATLPDIFVFRYPNSPFIGLDDENRADIEAQWQKLKSFAERVFVSAEGHFKGAYQTFSSTDDFEMQAEGALRQWLSENVLKDRAVVWPTAVKGSPFRGLEPFGAKHAEVFYGRDGDRGRALDRLKDAAEAGFPFLAIIGPSGAGKSSFARAGILPWLVKPGAVTGVGVWRTAVMRPSDHPNGAVAGLARHLFDDEKDIAEPETGRPVALPELASGDSATPQALAGLFSVFARGKFEQAEDLENAGRAAMAPIEKALKLVAEADRKAWGSEKETPARLLLVIDQFDELFAPGVDDAGRAAFARLIERLVRSDLVWVVATLRAEFYEAFLKSPLAWLASPETSDANKRLELTFDLLPPGLPEMAEIVRGPARAAGLDWEADRASGERLDNRLLTDIDRPDLLPLVQFVLEQLYEQRERKDEADTLTFDAYSALGTLDGAIDKAAEKALSQLGPAEQAALPRLLRALVTYARPVSGGGKSAVALVQAARKTAAYDEASTRLVDALTEARILVSGNDQDKAPTIALAHQRVIEAWQRAEKIVGESEGLLRIRDEVEQARRRWIESGQRRDRLIPAGLPLSEAETVASTLGDELPAESRTYIERSGRAARLRQTLTAAAAIVFLVVAGVAGWQWSEADAQRNLAEQQKVLAEVKSKEAAEQTALAGRRGLEAQSQRDAAEKNASDAIAQKTIAEANQSAALSSLAETRVSSNPTEAIKLALASWPRDVTTENKKAKFTFSLMRKAITQLFERHILVGHTDEISDVEFSPDQSLLLTVSVDGSARTWDAKSGAAKLVFDPKSGPLYRAHFSADGSKIVTAGKDGVARLWDAKDGQELVKLSGHEKDLTDAVFSPEGSRVVTSSSDQTARLWDAITGRQIAVLQGHQDNVQSAAFSPDGGRIVTVSGDIKHSVDPSIGIWDGSTGKLISLVRGPLVGIKRVAFSPDGKSFVTASCGIAVGGEPVDHSVRTWDLQTGRQIATMLGHQKCVEDVTFSPNGRFVASASLDGTARIWEASNGRELRKLVQGGERGALGHVAFSTGGSRILTASIDGSIKVWDTASGQEVAVLNGHTRSLVKAIYSRSGDRIVSASLDKTARIWDSTSFTATNIIGETTGSVNSAIYSRDGSRILTVSTDGTAKLREAPSLKLLSTIANKEYYFRKATISSDARRIATIDTDNVSSLWDSESGKRLVSLNDSSSLEAIAFSSDGSKLAVVKEYRTIAILNSIDGSTVRELTGASHIISDLAFSPNGLIVAATSVDGTARLWNLVTGEMYATLKGHRAFIACVQFSNDGTRLVTASADSTARIWDSATGNQLAVLRGHSSRPVSSAEFSPDGRRVVTGGSDGARIFDALTGRQLVIIRNPGGTAHFSPSGQLLIAGSRVWEAETGSQLMELKGHTGTVSSAVFSPDGAHGLTASQDGTARLWDLSGIPRGGFFRVACGWLADRSLEDLSASIGLGRIAPICSGSEPLPAEQVLTELAGTQQTYEAALGDARSLLFAGDFEKALLRLERTFRNGNQQRRAAASVVRAHALLLLGRTEEARAAYETGEGQLIRNFMKLGSNGENANVVWEQIVIDDFNELRAAGMERPLMREVEARYRINLQNYEEVEGLARRSQESAQNKDRRAAFGPFRRWIELSGLRLQEQPANRKFMQLQYEAYEDLSSYEKRLKDAGAAEADLRKAVSLLEGLAAKYDDDVIWQYDLMKALFALTEFESDERKYETLSRCEAIGTKLYYMDDLIVPDLFRIYPNIMREIVEIAETEVGKLLEDRKFEEALTAQHRIVTRLQYNVYYVGKGPLVANALLRESWDALLARKFDIALGSAQRSIDLSESPDDQLPPLTNKAHALMFLNRLDEAREIYRSGRGRVFKDKKTWESVILNDFDELRKAGRAHPFMAVITTEFTKK